MREGKGGEPQVIAVRTVEKKTAVETKNTLYRILFPPVLLDEVENATVEVPRRS